jgi:ferredoxin-nitrate reductase
MSEETPTICPYCGVGCGLVATVERGRLRSVRGDALYPVNRGRTCRKPLELPSAVHARDRATVPLLRTDRERGFREAGWDEAIATVAARLRALIDAHGPDSIAFYISGQLLSEDYYAVNKLAKGFLGTNNVDSNSRLCMSSAVAGYAGAFGSDGPPPSYADIEAADCFFLLGTNTAECHPIVWARIRDRQEQGAFVVCADPRATATARASDLHLPVRPGTDLALVNAMLHVIERDGLLDTGFVARHTTGWDETAAVARRTTPELAAETCGVPAADIEEAARRFAQAGAALALWSMGANQSSVGTMKNRALINLCLATGQIGRPGAGPFSLTGQPNAMGGRETGGLAHLLPGYRSVESAEDRAELERYWGVPAGRISSRPGLPAVELFDALESGRVKAVWIVATNPLVSLPEGGRTRAALERAELVVCQDAYHPTETTALAHVVLPAAAWPEKEGTMTNSERRVGLLRRALDPPGEALPDWRIFARVAAALGFGDVFAWQDEAEVFAELAACTAGRVCDLSAISHERLRAEGSVQWGGARLYEDHRYPTPDGRARFEPTPHFPPAERTDHEFPLTLTTGRVADHWHTMTRTGKSPVLAASSPEPFVELNPDDAVAAGVRDGEPARVISRRGEATLRATLIDTLPRGVAFAPFHWGALHAPPGAGTVNATTHGAVDPVSRQPELKALAVRVEPAARKRPKRRTRRLVVVGTGMAGLQVVDELHRRRPRDRWHVTMLGEEPVPTYNRVLLSKLLARASTPAELELRPAAWYAEREVELRASCPARALDLEGRIVFDGRGGEHRYDRLVLATGSRPLIPPISGARQKHVFLFRTARDVERIAARARRARHAVVVGGGLLGLEAAAGLRAHGVEVTVVERADRLMPQQLDAGAAAILQRSLDELGIRSMTGCGVATIWLDRVRLQTGDELPADLVVLAAGVRPETSLARGAGIETRSGILVDDELRTSAPSVFAVGECVEHRGTVYGLWAPLAEQAAAAAAAITGDPGAFTGHVQATTLKVAGVEVFAGGAQSADALDELDEIVWSDGRRGVYRKLVLDGDRLAGALLVGDSSLGRELSALLRSGGCCPPSLLDPETRREPAAPSDGDVVCSCNVVTRGAILDAIRVGKLETAAQVAQATRASSGCGSCTRDVEALLAAS